jgi:hypothetical protein
MLSSAENACDKISTASYGSRPYDEYMYNMLLARKDTTDHQCHIPESTVVPASMYLVRLITADHQSPSMKLSRCDISHVGTRVDWTRRHDTKMTKS